MDLLFLTSTRRTVRVRLLAALIVPIAFIGACVGGLFLWVAVDTADAGEKADTFLALLAEGNVHDAYAGTAFLFRTEQDEQRFTSVVRRVGLTRYVLQPWRDRILTRQGRGQFLGTLESASGRTMPFTVEVVREADEWRVLSLTGPERRSVGPGAWFRQAPTDEELQRLTKETILAFKQAIGNRDFTEFRNDMTTALTPEQLQETYQQFIDEEIDLSGVERVGAVFDGPPVMRWRVFGDARVDVLTVSGYYPIDPSPLAFTFRYTYHHPDWQLSTLHVIPPAKGTGSAST